MKLFEFQIWLILWITRMAIIGKLASNSAISYGENKFNFDEMMMSALY